MQLDSDLKQHLAEAHCHRCGTDGAVALIGIDYPHFGRVICAHAAGELIDSIRSKGDQHYLDWLQAPNQQTSTARRRTKRHKVDNLTDRCEICLRHVAELTSPNELHYHHVVEVQDGGTDTDDNLRVYCNDCHNLIHWARRSLNRSHAE